MTDIVHRLSASDLSALSMALRSGRLMPPFSDVAVRRHCGAAVAGEVSVRLTRLADDGMEPRHIAAVFEAVAAARASQPKESDLVELVWTGPETPGIANRDTGAVLWDLFGSAEREVMAVGFAVYQGKNVFRRLAERMLEMPQLKVRLFLDIRRPYGDATPASELVWKFLTRFRTEEWPGSSLPELYYDPRSLDDSQEKRSSLHAKCVVVDRQVAFVTSANFTQAAQTRNIEVGALIRSPQFAAELQRHFERLVVSGQLLATPESG